MNFVFKTFYTASFAQAYHRNLMNMFLCSKKYEDLLKEPVKSDLGVLQAQLCFVLRNLER